MTRPKVYICSPYSGDTERNIMTAIGMCWAATNLGYNPLAPHLYYTQWLRDSDPEDRVVGLAMGIELLECCAGVWCHTGDGVSSGMAAELAVAEARGMPVFTTYDYRHVRVLGAYALMMIREDGWMPPTTFDRSVMESMINRFEAGTMLRDRLLAEMLEWIEGR